MEDYTKGNHGAQRKAFRSFGIAEGKRNGIQPMGKVTQLEGARFTFSSVAILKEILLDNRIFPGVTAIDVNEYGFGYFTIYYGENQRRRHIHWYELAVRVLPPHLFSVQELSKFYTGVFITDLDPIQLLKTKYNWIRNASIH